MIPSLFAAYFLTWTIDFLSPSARASKPARVLVEEDEKVEIKPSVNGSEVDIMTTDTITVTVCAPILLSHPVSPYAERFEYLLGYPHEGTNKYQHDSLQPSYIKHARQALELAYQCRPSWLRS